MFVISLKNNYKFSNIIFWACLYLFAAIVMVDPANRLFHMKESAFVLLMFVTVILGRGKIYKDIVDTIIALFVLASSSICMSILVYQADVSSSISYFKSLFFIFVVFSISKIDPPELIQFCYRLGLGLASFISLLLLASVGGLFDLTTVVTSFADGGAVYLARREFLGMETVMFFYATMPFCFFSLIYAFRRGKLLQVIILLVPIVYGGSRTPILMAIAIICYVLYDRKSKWLRYLLAFVFVIAISYLLILLTSKENADGGDEIKYAVGSYLLWNSSLFGHGVGIEYWDPGRQEMTASTEVTYLEMLYQYGWLLAPFVIFMFIKPFFTLYKKQNETDVRDFAIAYLLYLITAGTNPLLINSTGMWVFACALTLATKLKEDNWFANNGIQDNVTL